MSTLIRAVYERASLVFSGRYYTTINELTDQIPALRPEVLWEAGLQIVGRGDFACDKLLVEEDKGAAIGAVVSVMTGVPLAMARPYAYSIPSIKVAYDSEYVRGDLYMNGIEPGERVVIVDDTISTGGVVTALIDAIRGAGATVHDAVALVEKVDNDGVRRVREATGVTVKTVLRIRIEDGRVVVL